MQSTLEDRDWKLLLRQISRGRCTPILGPGVYAGLAPLRNELAQDWSHEYDYPLADNNDLARVAQYLSVNFDPLYAKEKIQEQLEAVAKPNFSELNQPHAALANLDLPIYITTNYDNFILDALKERRKDPQLELCRWNAELLRSYPSVLETGYSPTPAQPLVYHLHGHYDSPESLVLTEDDYLDFLVNISSEEYRLPARIQQSLTGASLLFLGYNPTDWDFRVLFRGLVAATESSLRRISVTVQLPPLPEGTPEAVQQKVQKFLNDYFGSVDNRMRVYWGSTQDFISELSERWQGNQVKERDQVQQIANSTRLDPSRILQNLIKYFDKEELRSLAFELRVDYDSLSEKKDVFARELIVYLQRRQRLNELVEAGRQWRPKAEW